LLAVFAKKDTSKHLNARAERSAFAGARIYHGVEMPQQAAPALPRAVGEPERSPLCSDLDGATAP